MAYTEYEIVDLDDADEAEASICVIDMLSDGTMLWLRHDSITEDVHIYGSTDDGETWSEYADMGYVDHTLDPGISMFVDANDVIWLAHEGGGSGQLRVKRGTLSGSTITWSADRDMTGVSDSRSVMRAFEWGGEEYVVIAASDGSTQSLLVFRWGASACTNLLDDSVGAGANSRAIYMDFHHDGRGKKVASGGPHIYVGWNDYDDSNNATISRYAFSETETWTQGTGYTTDTYDWIKQFFFDGTRIVLVEVDSGDDLYVTERNEANSSGTAHSSIPSLSTYANGFTIACFYDKDDDLYLLQEIGLTYNDTHAIVYDRSADSWGTWSQVLDAGRAQRFYVNPSPTASGTHPLVARMTVTADTVNYLDTGIEWAADAAGGGGFGAFGL